ncbi:DUF6234 family protein [Streptomyces adustus]|uniref:DUF6234 family protein n=1 Tax=Streptomyces adustus TaxID=1609272 RepID=UPI0035DF7BAC
MNADPERKGRLVAIAVALAVVEVAALALIWLSWAATYWSFDPQSYGVPPGPYLREAAFVAVAALVASVVGAVRRSHVITITQIVMVVVVCGVLSSAKVAGERAYETSYRDACRSGLGCATTPPTP